MRKICVVSPVHNSNDVRVFHKISLSLKDNGYNVVLFCKNNGKDEFKNGVNIKTIPELGKYMRFLYLFVLLFKLFLEKSDVYHFNNPDTLPLALLMKKMGYRVVYDTHEDFSQRILVRDWIPIKARDFIASIVVGMEKKLCISADGFFVTQKELLNKYHKAVLLLNPPIIDIDFVKKVKAESIDSVKNKPMLIYVGHTISQARGIEQLINALEIANKKVRVGLWLIGEIDDTYLKKIASMNGFKYVQYLGYMDYIKAMSYVNNADIGIAAILDVADHKNTSANKLYEYMLFGIPFIGTNFPKWQKELENIRAGYFINPLDVKNYSELIVKMISQKEFSKEMGNEGKKYIQENFNWKIESEKLLSVYREILP